MNNINKIPRYAENDKENVCLPEQGEGTFYVLNIILTLGKGFFPH